MYAIKFKRNMPIYLVLKKVSSIDYEVIECFHNLDNAYSYIYVYGNSSYFILKLKLKEVIDWKFMFQKITLLTSVI